ncbi:hypothetical protein CFN78_20025 [Amycolatopsis antarctica]|uniref:PE domain-containing protein n=1 Tax=Amycolatopsis antarctica TaxID=1854586 RepID=A0A263CZE8_9PSEU|nr:hypothetical protein CFN78_20025 [Amycolatopsis antarctica]
MYTPPAPVSALAGSVPGVPGAVDIEVEPERVAAVAKVIEDQANALHEKLRNQLGHLHIDAPSEDVVSTHAIEAWNKIVSDGEDSYEQRVRAYVTGLRELAQQLRGAGEQYTDGEQDRADSLGDRGVYHV